MQAIEVGQVWETRKHGSVTVQGATGEKPYTWFVSTGRSVYSVDDNGFIVGRNSPTPFDLVRLLTPAPIDLTEQTIDTFAKIVRNGGKVPDGIECEGLCEDGSWTKLIQPAALFFDNNYRLSPLLPPVVPRFSVSTDPIGVLDSQQPGMVAKFTGGIDASNHIAGMLNRGERHPSKYDWTPIATEMVPLDNTDIIVGKTLIRTKYGTCLVLTVSSDGVSYAMPCFDEKADRKQSTLKPISEASGSDVASLIHQVTWIVLQKQAEYSNDEGASWQKCEKVKP